MKELIKPAAEQLFMQVQLPSPDASIVCHCLQQITAVFQSTKVAAEGAGQAHPTLGLYAELWPILDLCFSKLALASEQAAEEACRVCKYAIKATQHEFVPHLQALVERLLSCHKAKPRCSYLDVSSIT